ncbi:MAG: hypothetical protein R3E92_12510 [Burkholderiaceae bacterium]
MPVTTVAALGENDRSATGFLPPPEFERMADAFSRGPRSRCVDGNVPSTPSGASWTRCSASPLRTPPAAASPSLSHGAVGTLLYCHLAGKPIDRRWDQPANGGGNFFRFTMAPPRALGWWKPIDTPGDKLEERTP